MRFASLGSGSKGNGTLVENDGCCVLVDCGFSMREAVRRMARLGRDPGDLTALLVTHEHADHIKGVVPLARKYRLPVIMTAGTARALSGIDGPNLELRLELISAYRPFAVGGLEVTPVAVPHDASEPVQYIFESGGRRLGVLTDLGCITPRVSESYRLCDGLLLEANHDPQMLAGGSYPPFLKRRVAGDWGHLNNGQAAGLLATVERSRLQCLAMSHISLRNNRTELVDQAIAGWKHEVGQLVYACQHEGFPWQTLV